VITVKFWRVNVKDRAMPGIPTGYLNHIDAVPEKALKGKALSHRVTYEPHLKRIAERTLTISGSKKKFQLDI
jgi:hypothetical protein